ncbi:hypothetical protein [Cystobacter fuscus]|uniref:hypothetical protein n=1 Tax=Cystobacter fuscus TaxID=43 RepID=UPI002B28DF15|nr:hypothetical protein F0U63_32035 [Cystobacter fuscus]
MGYIGLNSQVRYRMELGFAFVDDGDKLFKVDGALFQQLAAHAVAAPPPEGPVRDLVGRLTTIFREYDGPEEALRSFEDAEL